MEEPHPLGRYLGVQHAFKSTGPPGAKVTEVEFDMSGYFLAKVRKLVEDTCATRMKADTPHAPEPDSKVFEANLEKPGELDIKHRPSHLMGALYSARMAHPGLSTAITRLTCHIHSWNAECERRLHRLFA